MKSTLPVFALVIIFILSACHDEQNIEWGTINLTDTKYSIKLETRFNDGHLSYIIRMFPDDGNLIRLANTVTVELLDREHFLLGIIEPESWARNNDIVSTRGRISFTRSNYRALGAWNVKWRY